PPDLGRRHRHRSRFDRNNGRLQPRIRILFPSPPNRNQPGQETTPNPPYLDGHQTLAGLWGRRLFWAFPEGHAGILPAPSLPVIVMLIALVFRGIAFEFRHVSYSKTGWNVAFVVGSTVATVAQGVILGGLIQGIAVRDGAFSGGPFDWATSFAFLCGLSLVA